jgi:type III restriction enzyme
MLQLKRYQQQVLDRLADYFRSAVQSGDADMAFYQMTREKYQPVPDLPGLPYVCLRLPTGGGKTLVACHSVAIAAREYLRREYPLVLWLVPTNTIREQTLAALRDRRHPYRQVLDAAFGGRVTVMDIREALFLSRSALEGGVCLVVSTLAALRREDTEGLKVYENSGALMAHFSGLPSEIAAWLDKSEGEVVYSLANLLRLHRPLVVVDEAHNARTPLSFETLARFAPACILEITATPARDSNVLAHASAAQLHAEAMIKLPIKLRAFANWQDALNEAIRQRADLEELARREQDASGQYLRPILLLQAQPRSAKQETLTVDVLQGALQQDFKIDKSQIAIATGDQREIEGLNLFDPKCPIRFIITVRALAEGWDCSFAYVLCSVAHIRSSTAVEQILGRVLRLPYACRQEQPELNQAYAFVTSDDFAATAAALTDALVDNGFERYEAQAALQAPPVQVDLPLFALAAQKQLSLAEAGVPFVVPRLAIRVDGQLELFEESFLPVEWELAKCDPALSEEAFPVARPTGMGIEIYLGDEEKLKQRFIGNLHAQLALLDRAANWTVNELVIWLDRNIPHPDVPQSHSSLFLRRMVDYLVDRRGLALEQLVHDRFRLRDAAQALIATHRQAAKRTGFQRCLSPDMRPQLEVSPEFAFRFPPDQYPANTYYEGRYQFGKHYYRAVGELKSEGEEFRCAHFLDTLPQVKHWVRNLDRRGFWFQTSTDKFYPDFVAELADGRYLVVEYKGFDRYDTPDSKEKRAIGELWQALSAGQGIFVMPTRGDFEAIRRAIS